jgi:membrane-associated protein
MITISIYVNNFLLFLDAESLIRYGGLLLACLIVYGSTGLFFCFFLPSGAVLFTAGIFTATGDLPQNLFTVCSLLILSSFAGSISGYAFGWKAGKLLYKRDDSKFFRRKHLIAAESFYKKYGNIALSAGFYLPIIRTFAAVVAGMIRLNFRRFALLTFIGSVAWVLGFVLAGYFIGSRPFLKPWLKYIVIGFILLVTIPLIIKTVMAIKKHGKEKK